MFRLNFDNNDRRLNQRRGHKRYNDDGVYPRGLLWSSHSPMEHFLQPFLDDDFGDIDRLLHDADHRFALWNPNQMSKQLTEKDLRQIGVDDNHWASAVNTCGFSPEQVKVSLDGNMLTVSGSNDWKSEDGSRVSSKTFSQSVLLPKEVKLETLKSKMLADGSMIVHAEQEQKKPKVESVKEIPIEFVNKKGDKEK